MSKFQEIFDEAVAAGHQAYADLEDVGPIGLFSCRLDGRSAFARWCREQGHGSTSDYGMFGKGTWVSDQCRHQSYQSSSAYSKAFCAVLNKHGIRTFDWGWYD